MAPDGGNFFVGVVVWASVHYVAIFLPLLCIRGRQDIMAGIRLLLAVVVVVFLLCGAF